MQKRIILIAAILIVAGVLVQVEQYAIWGHWFDFDQIHHETFSCALVFAGIVVLLIGWRFTLAKRRRQS